MAAVLACGEGAVLSHRSAARHWGVLGGAGTGIEVSSPQRRRRPGIRTPRATLAPHDVTVHEQIPVTSVARTLLDLADVAPARLVERAIHEAETLRLFDLRAFDDVLARATGRRGAGVLRGALEGHRAGPVLTRSDREEMLLALVGAADLPRPRFNVWIEGFELDAYWPEHRLAVEVDSHQFHYTTRRFESDRERDVVLLRAGVRTARITTRRLQNEPEAVAHDLRELLVDSTMTRSS